MRKRFSHIVLGVGREFSPPLSLWRRAEKKDSTRPIWKLWEKGLSTWCPTCEKWFSTPCLNFQQYEKRDFPPIRNNMRKVTFHPDLTSNNMRKMTDNSQQCEKVTWGVSISISWSHQITSTQFEKSGGEHFLINLGSVWLLIIFRSHFHLECDSRNISCNIPTQSIFHEMLTFSYFLSWVEVPLVFLGLGNFLIIAKWYGGKKLIFRPTSDFSLIWTRYDARHAKSDFPLPALISNNMRNVTCHQLATTCEIPPWLDFQQYEKNDRQLPTIWEMDFPPDTTTPNSAQQNDPTTPDLLGRSFFS